MHISSHCRHNRWGDKQLVALILLLDANKPLTRWRNKNSGSQMSDERKFGVNMTSERGSTQIWCFRLQQFFLFSSRASRLFRLHFVKLYFYHLTEHKNLFAMLRSFFGGRLGGIPPFAQVENAHKNRFFGSALDMSWHVEPGSLNSLSNDLKDRRGRFIGI